MMLPEPTEVIPTRNPRAQADDRHTRKRFQRWRSIHHAVLDTRLKHQQDRNAYQQDPDRELDDGICTVAIKMSKVGEIGDAAGRTRHAADRECQHYFAAHRAFLQVDDAGGNLGEKVEQGVRSHCRNHRNSQAENQDGQQQHAAAQPC